MGNQITQNIRTDDLFHCITPRIVEEGFLGNFFYEAVESDIYCQIVQFSPGENDQLLGYTYMPMKLFNCVLVTLWFISGFSSPTFASAGSCLSSYGYEQIYDNHSAWGEQVFDNALDFLAREINSMAALSLDEKIDRLSKPQIRGLFFRLEALARIYKAEATAEFSKIKDYFKSIEDSIGALDLENTLLSTATQLNDPGLIEYFESRKLLARKGLRSSLEKNNLINEPNTAIQKIKERIKESIAWKSAAKDKKFHLKSIIQELDELQEDIEKRKFSKSNIEKGLHELRRRIRWVGIHIQSLDRFAKYDEEFFLNKKSSTWYYEMLAVNPKLLDNPFLKLNTTIINNPLLIPKYFLAMLGEIVAQIGVKKDMAESDLYISAAMNALNYSAADQQRVMNELLLLTHRVDEVDHEALAKYYQEMIEQTNLLRRFKKRLLEINGKNK